MGLAGLPEDGSHATQGPEERSGREFLRRGSQVVTCLSHNRLARANLMNADLTQADLTRADLTDAKLAQANLDEAIFTNAVGIGRIQGLDKARNRDKAIFDAHN